MQKEVSVSREGKEDVCSFIRWPRTHHSKGSGVPASTESRSLMRTPCAIEIEMDCGLTGSDSGPLLLCFPAAVARLRQSQLIMPSNRVYIGTHADLEL